MLRQWAVVLKERWTIDNLPLISRGGGGGDDAGVRQIVGAIVKVSDALGNLCATMAKLQSSMDCRLGALEPTPSAATPHPGAPPLRALPQGTLLAPPARAPGAPPGHLRPARPAAAGHPACCPVP